MPVELGPGTRRSFRRTCTRTSNGVAVQRLGTDGNWDQLEAATDPGVSDANNNKPTLQYLGVLRFLTPPASPQTPHYYETLRTANQLGFVAFQG